MSIIGANYNERCLNEFPLCSAIEHFGIIKCNHGKHEWRLTSYTMKIWNHTIMRIIFWIFFPKDIVFRSIVNLTLSNLQIVNFQAYRRTLKHLDRRFVVSQSLTSRHDKHSRHRKHLIAKYRSAPFNLIKAHRESGFPSRFFKIIDVELTRRG